MKGQLDEFESKNGALSSVVEFVVEKAIPDALEIGSDSYCIDGEFPNNNFIGAEIKDQAYFGKLVDYDDLPDNVKEINTKLSEHMEGYRQFWSTEVREKDGVGYLVDITARHASPAGETFCQLSPICPKSFGAERRANSLAPYLPQSSSLKSSFAPSGRRNTVAD